MRNYLSKFILKDKVAYVTGGLGLIGSEISKALASAGAYTVILDIDKAKGMRMEKEIKRSGYSASYEDFDITKLQESDDRISELAKKYKSIDIWVNSAYPRTKDWGAPVERLNIDSWRKNVDMQLNSYSWISRKVCLVMKKNGGALINIGSIYGVVGNDFNIYEGTSMTSPMAYTAIKGGIVNLDRYLASYFSKYNIRVNTLCPGGVFDKQNKIFVKNYEKKVPLKRMAKPEDIASAVLFLSSDAASYINGATIMVDGGWTAV